MSVFAELIGKTIKSALIDAEHESLVFVTGDGSQFAYEAQGDCCSHSWIEHINGLSNLFGNEVLRIIDHLIPDNVLNPDPYTKIELYGWTLETATSRIDIEMRNESNGYYGGWMQYRNPVPEHWKLIPLTEDF